MPFRTYRPFGGNSPPSGSFRLNEDHWQAQDLWLWIPGSDRFDYSKVGHGPLTSGPNGTDFIVHPERGIVLEFNDTLGYDSPEAWQPPAAVSPITIMFWVNKTTPYDGNTGVIIGTGTGNTDEYDIRLGNDENFDEWTGGPANVGPVTLDEWAHCAYTNDGSIARIYVDGIEGGNDNSPAAPSALTNFSIGEQSGFNVPFGGLVSDVRMYTEVLSPDQIYNIYSPEGRWELWWQPVRSFFLPNAAAGGTTYNETIAEALSVVDAVSEVATFPETAAETLSLVDAASELATFERTIAETLSEVDAASEVATFPESVAEDLSLIDSADENATFPESVAESLDLADTVDKTLSFDRSVAESLALSDTATEYATFVRSVAESLSLVDTATRQVTLVRTLAETLSLVDASTEVATFPETLAESLSLVDETTALVAFLKTLAETLSFTDTATETATFAETVAETLSLVDVSSETATFLRTVAESLDLTDTSTEVATFVRTLAETFTVVDEAIGSIAGGGDTFNVSVAEVLAFVDALTHTMGSGRWTQEIKLAAQTWTEDDAASGTWAEEGAASSTWTEEDPEE